MTNAGRASAQKMSKTLGEPFHRVLTAEDAGATKPDPRVFQFLLRTLKEEFGVDKEEILHVAQSQFHDIKIAKEMGFSTAWIERRHGQQGSGGTPDEADKAEPTFHATSLADFAEQHRRALGGEPR